MEDFADIVTRQGWNTLSELNVVLGFIEHHRLEGALAAYAAERAALENA